MSDRSYKAQRASMIERIMRGELNKTQRKILAFIESQKGGASAPEISRCVVGVSRGRIELVLGCLRDAGELAHRGFGPLSRWCRPGDEAETIRTARALLWGEEANDPDWASKCEQRRRYKKRLTEKKRYKRMLAEMDSQNRKESSPRPAAFERRVTVIPAGEAKPLRPRGPISVFHLA